MRWPCNRELCWWALRAWMMQSRAPTAPSAGRGAPCPSPIHGMPEPAWQGQRGARFPTCCLPVACCGEQCKAPNPIPSHPTASAPPPNGALTHPVVFSAVLPRLALASGGVAQVCLAGWGGAGWGGAGWGGAGGTGTDQGKEGWGGAERGWGWDGAPTALQGKACVRAAATSESLPSGIRKSANTNARAHTQRRPRPRPAPPRLQEGVQVCDRAAGHALERHAQQLQVRARLEVHVQVDVGHEHVQADRGRVGEGAKRHQRAAGRARHGFPVEVDADQQQPRACVARVCMCVRVRVGVQPSGGTGWRGGSATGTWRWGAGPAGPQCTSGLRRRVSRIQ